MSAIEITKATNPLKGIPSPSKLVDFDEDNTRDPRAGQDGSAGLSVAHDMSG